MGNQIYLNGITLEELAEALRPLLVTQNAGQTPQSQDDLLTRKQAYEYLQVSESTLQKYTKNGKLTPLGIGNRIFYRKSDLLAALKPTIQ